MFNKFEINYKGSYEANKNESQWFEMSIDITSRQNEIFFKSISDDLRIGYQEI